MTTYFRPVLVNNGVRCFDIKFLIPVKFMRFVFNNVLFKSILARSAYCLDKQILQTMNCLLLGLWTFCYIFR